jgi:hypothetical protein
VPKQTGGEREYLSGLCCSEIDTQEEVDGVAIDIISAEYGDVLKRTGHTILVIKVT